jgi:prophage regulatory protein
VTTGPSATAIDLIRTELDELKAQLRWMKRSTSLLPTEGYVDTKQIVGDRRSGTPGVLPISESLWWDGVRNGKYPKGFKHGGRTFWRAQDIRTLLAQIETEGADLDRPTRFESHRARFDKPVNDALKAHQVCKDRRERRATNE